MRKLLFKSLLTFLFFLVLSFGFREQAQAAPPGCLPGCWSPPDVEGSGCPGGIPPCPAGYPREECPIGGDIYCCPDPDACVKERKAAEGFKPVPCLGGDGIESAIGCIPTSATGFSEFFLKWFLGIAGVIAFFLIIVAGFQILTSAGDPEKLQGAKQLLTAAIVGLLFVVFAVVILQIMGLSLLGEPPGFPRFIP